MLRNLAFGLSLALMWVHPASAQKPTPKDPSKKETKPSIEWVKDRGALRSAFQAGPDNKPVLLFINTRPKLLEKLKNLDDPTIIKYSKQFRCIYYEVNPRGDWAYDMMKREGLGAYENKLTFFDPSKVDQSKQPKMEDLRRPGGMSKWFKELRKGVMWQPKPSTKAVTLGRGMHNMLKKMDRLPKAEPADKKPKKADEAKRPGRHRRPRPEADEPRSDPARNLFERGESFEKNGKVYQAWKAFGEAARHRTEYGSKARAAVKRLETDRSSAKVIQQETMDQKAAAWLSLGKSFQKNEKWKLAASYYRRILKTYPKSKHAAEAKERLATVTEKLEG